MIKLMSTSRSINFFQVSPKFHIPFHCHFPNTPSKTTRISIPINNPTSNFKQTQIPTKTHHFYTPKMSSNDNETIINNNNNFNSGNNNEFDQNVIVMRHGDRMDNFVPSWVTTAQRPWDPPLVDAGKTRAFNVGTQIRTQLDFPIHRVFVSPFLRCVQTAAEVVSALGSSSSDSDNKVKVAIEYGLCEMLNREAIRPEYAPKDGDFRFNISELEALLPAGTVDHSVTRVYEEMPRWEETVLGSRSRYEHVIQALADKYPRENILLVTHGEGVGTSVSSFKKRAFVYEVNYCAYSHARRHVTFGENGSSTAGNFQLLTVPHATGIGYDISNTLADGV